MMIDDDDDDDNDDEKNRRVTRPRLLSLHLFTPKEQLFSQQLFRFREKTTTKTAKLTSYMQYKHTLSPT